MKKITDYPDIEFGSTLYNVLVEEDTDYKNVELKKLSDGNYFALEKDVEFTNFTDVLICIYTPSGNYITCMPCETNINSFKASVVKLSKESYFIGTPFIREILNDKELLDCIEKKMFIVNLKY
jgi:hypothetical protein